MKNSNNDLYKHLGWCVDLLDGISDNFSCKGFDPLDPKGALYH